MPVELAQVGWTWFVGTPAAMQDEKRARDLILEDSELRVVNGRTPPGNDDIERRTSDEATPPVDDD